MRIAYFAAPSPSEIHDLKWIYHFASNPKSRIVIFCPEFIKFNMEESQLKGLNTRVCAILPGAYPLFNFLKRNKILREIKKILKEENIQLIHSMYVVHNSFWPYRIRFKNHVITTRGSDILVDYKDFCNYNKSNLKLFITNFLLKREVENCLNHAAFITSTSYTQQKIIQEIVKNKGKLKLIRTGVNVSKINILKVKHEDITKNEEKIILSPRVMRPLYNIDIIVRAFSNILDKDKNQNIKLWLIDGFVGSEYSKKIKNLIQSLGLNNKIVIFPAQDFEGMINLYKRSDLTIMIPKSDGIPNSGIEAMLVGCPVIIGAIKYDDDIFNEDTVWQLNTNSHIDLSNTIIDLLNTEKQLIDKKIKNAYNAASKFAGLDHSLKKVEDIYLSLLNSDKK